MSSRGILALGWRVGDRKFNFLSLRKLTTSQLNNVDFRENARDIPEKKRAFNTLIRTKHGSGGSRVSRKYRMLLRSCTTTAAKIEEEHISNKNNNDTIPTRQTPTKSQLFMKLGKAQLTFGTAVMAGAGYLAVGRFSAVELGSVFFGTWILGMSGGAANQIIERDLDFQMARTRGRPLPSGQLSLREAYAFTTASGGIGVGLLLFGATPISASVGIATWLAYIAYTFSKTRTVYNTHIGAISGALPLVIGWTGGGGLILDFQCLSEFAAMWFWQFAHFNVISWQYRLDYLRAGFKMQSGIDMAKEKGRMALGGWYAFAGSFFFAAVPLVSIMHGYNSPLFLTSYLATAPFVYQMAQFWRNPVNTKTLKIGGRSLSPLAVGGITLLVYLISFAFSSTRWGEDGTKDFLGYSLSNVLPSSLSAMFSRHCPVHLAMDNKRLAASHSATGLDPQFHSQEEMWRVFHGMALFCPTYYHLPKTVDN